MSKQTAAEYLEEAQRHLKLAINNLYSVIEELEELHTEDIDSWNLLADIQTQILFLEKVEKLIK
jgi:hypothetical protein